MHTVRALATPVIETVPAIPAAAIDTHLHEIAPDVHWRRIDRDGHRCAALGTGNNLGARKWTPHFVIGCAPSNETRPNEKRVGSHESQRCEYFLHMRW